MDKSTYRKHRPREPMLWKLIKQLAKKSLSVFWGGSLAPPNTLKLVSAKCLFNFVSRSWKIHFVSFQDFWHNHLRILLYNVLCYRKALNNNSNKWLLLGISPKSRFLNVQKIPKAQKLKKKMSSKKLSEWFGYKTFDLIY